MKSVPLLACAMAVLASCVVVAANQSDRPAGIDAKNWILVSERLGFVVDEKNVWPDGNASRQLLIAPPDAVSAELMPPAKGYFVVKTSAGWRRIAIAE